MTQTYHFDLLFNSPSSEGFSLPREIMTNIEILANEVLNMRFLQIKYSELMHRRKMRQVDGEELAETYSQMRDAEQKVHALCLDVVGIDEDVDYD